MITNNNLHIHEKFMAMALELAAIGRGYTAPNPMVGCLIVKDNQILGKGYHQKAGLPHAEINAINSCNNKEEIVGSTIYVTLEPCCHYGRTGPCVIELVKYKPKTLVIAMQDPNPLVAGKGVQCLKDAGIEVILGVGNEASAELNRGFISRIIKSQPYICSKIAASLDGGVALANGQSKWITNAICRQDVHLLRLYSDAIVTTAATVLADDPALTVRDLGDYQSSNDHKKQPLRVVIDRDFVTFDLLNRAKIYDQTMSKTIVIIGDTDAEKIQAFRQAGITVYNMTTQGSKINVTQVWQLLAELGCNDVLVEAGGRFNSYLLENGLSDEWLVYQSGYIMGPSAQPMFVLDNGQKNSLDQLFKLKCKEVKQFDTDWCLRLQL